MIIFDFGLSPNTILVPTLLSYLLFIGIMIIIYFILKKSNFRKIYRFITINFFTIWYFLLITIFSILTLNFYKEIDFTKFNLMTLISCVLIGLLILPFFKKVVAFGIEAELAFAKKAEGFHLMQQLEASDKPLTPEEKEEREKYTTVLTEIRNNSGEK